MKVDEHHTKLVKCLNVRLLTKDYYSDQYSPFKERFTILILCELNKGLLIKCRLNKLYE